MSSCTRRIVDFTIISTKNIDLSKGASFERGDTRVDGEDKKYVIIIIPTGTPDMEEALDLAMEGIPGCVALLDGVVYYKYWYFPLIYGESVYIVEGTPLIDPSLATNDTPKFEKITLSANGLKTIESISESEYNDLKNSYRFEGREYRFQNSGSVVQFP